jgi:hypothetical protein
LFVPKEEVMRKLMTVVASFALLFALVPAGAMAAEKTGNLSVVHGVPGVTVDVYVNGDSTPVLTGFEPGDQAGPLELPAGPYSVQIRPAGANPGSDPIIESSFTLLPNRYFSAVAHLEEDGDPRITVFQDPRNKPGRKNARLIVRHTAAAPPVDVVSGKKTLIANLTNPQGSRRQLRAGTYPVKVVASGTEITAFEADLKLKARTTYTVYAIGSLEDDTFEVLVFTS